MVPFVLSIKLQIILIKTLKKNNTQIKKPTFFLWRNSPTPAYAASLLRVLNDTHAHTGARAHAHTYPVGLLWTSDQLVAEAAYLHNTQQTQQTNIHALGEIRNRDTRNLAASYLRLRPHGNRDRPKSVFTHVK